MRVIYYNGEKLPFAKWTKRLIPKWIERKKEGINNAGKITL